MKKSLSFPVLVLLLSLLILSPFCLAMSERGPEASRQKGTAPDFVLKDLSGNKLRLSDLKGKVVFLNFFAHWCPPCRSEMPSMQALYGKLKGKNFEMVAVAVESSPKNDAESLVRSGGYTFRVLLDSNGAVAEKYGVRGIPATFVIDKKGRVVFEEVGSRDWSRGEVVKELKGLMK